MQLFVTEYTKKGETIIIIDSDLLSQVRKVLRSRIGDHIRIQSPTYEQKKIRYEIRIDVWDNKMLEGSIVSQQHHDIQDKKSTMIIAMPNKWDKVELIIQKLTECGIDKIIFWPSERSVIKDWNTKKQERLYKIIKEAVEQSRGRIVPELNFTHDINTYIQDTQLIVFDKIGVRNKEQKISEKTKGTRDNGDITGLVGPEGGLTTRDYEQFGTHILEIFSLGDTVLRMETAAIVGGRLVKNNDKPFGSIKNI